MSISMECPSCMNAFSLPDELAGRKSKCPECQFVLFVPRVEGAVDAAASSSPTTDTPAPDEQVAEVMAAPTNNPKVDTTGTTPAPSKKVRALPKQSTATTKAPAPAAGDNPFEFSGNESSGGSRPRKKGGGAGIILLVLLALFLFGGFCVLVVAGGLAWFLLWPSANSTALTPPQVREEIRVAEPPKGNDDKEPLNKNTPKDETPKKDPPKNPGGKPVRDPIVDGPDPMEKPKPNPMPPPVSKKAQFTLSPLPPTMVKAGDKVQVNVSVMRVDCTGPVTISAFPSNAGISVGAQLALPQEFDQAKLEVSVAANVAPGTYQLTVIAMLLGKISLTDTKVCELTVVKTGMAAAVDPPPADNGNKPLQILGATVHLEGRSYTANTAAVECVALSADGKWGLAGSADGTVNLWELTKGQVATIFTAPGGTTFTAVAFSADGKMVASGDSKGSIRLHDLEKKETTFLRDATKPGPNFAANGNRINSLEFSPKGDLLIAADQFALNVLDVATGKESKYGALGESPNVRFSPDGDHVFAFSQKKLANVEIRKVGPLAFVGKDALFSISYFDIFPRRQELIAIVPQEKQAELQRINIATGQVQKLTTFEMPNEIPLRVAVADKAGFAITSDRDGLIRGWELDTGKEIFKLPGHKGEVHGLAVSADGRKILSGGADNTFRIVDLSNTKGDAPKPVNPPTPDPVKPPPPKKSARANENWEQKFAWQAHQKSVRSAAFSPDGKYLVTGGEDGRVHLWDAATAKSVRELGANATKVAPVAGLYFSGDGKTLLVAYEGREKMLSGWGMLYDTTTWTVKRPLMNGPKDRVRAMAISQDGSRVLSVGFSPQIVVWDAAKGVPTRTFTHPSLTNTENCSLDAEKQRVMCADKAGRCNLLNIAKEDVVFSTINYRESQGTNIFPDGKRAITWGDNTQVRTVDLATGKASTIFKGKLNGIAKASASPDGKSLAVATGTPSTSLLDVETQEEVFVFTQPQNNNAVALCFSPDNNRVAIGDSAGGMVIFVKAESK